MPPDSVTLDHLDYLQRSGFEIRPPSTEIVTPGADQRTLLRIRGIGKLARATAPVNSKPYRIPSENLTVGLFGHKIPLAFLVAGHPDGINVRLGTWTRPEGDGDGVADLSRRVRVLGACLDGLYPLVEQAPAEIVSLAGLPLSGMALGIPTPTPPDPSDNALPMDQLIRAMFGANWAYLVLAQPVDEGLINNTRRDVITELRTTQTQMARSPSPLAKHYAELLDVGLKTLTLGLATGSWRTAVYLLGDDESYYRLASVWRGIFSGDESLPEPLRVWDMPQVTNLADNWSMPDAAGQAGPGDYQHPFQYQTLLTSKQLAACVHLPHLETGGFSVKNVPHFDTMPPDVKETDPAMSLGNVIHITRPTGTPYQIAITDLTRHTLVAGVTGSGKTNTIFHLLKQATESDAPFLVIEPAKTEYRALLDTPELSERLRIFTLGNERVSPYRLNPFEVPSGIPVSVHLDLLRSAFTASFGMWTPLPQILEQCLYRIYEDYGWDITTNQNLRIDAEADDVAAFPTLADLAAKVDAVINQLGYEERIVSDMRAALLTRINGLRTGGKGRMLDTRRSLPMKLLLEQPTILELEGMGDDDDKAFIMGLILIRLAEYRRNEGQCPDLRHLLVIEEAHRLLTNVGLQSREEESNPRGKAVETFANLLSEVRAYGQGVVVADQVPVKLAPDVIKNTNLKMVHRIVAADDRAVLAGAMAMNEGQAHSLATLELGQAAVFGEGDDEPVLVKVPLAKPGNDSVADTRVADHMSANSETLSADWLLPYPACAETCIAEGHSCETARKIIEGGIFQRTFAHAVLSMIEDTDALDRLWPDILSVIAPQTPPAADRKEFLRCLCVHASEWFARRRGAQASCSYTETQTLADNLREVLLLKIEEAAPHTARALFQAQARELHSRDYDPFSGCSRICTQHPPVCLYRYAGADLMNSGDFTGSLRRATAVDTDPDGPGLRPAWEAAMDAGVEIIEFPEGDWPEASLDEARTAARRASLCFAQQVLGTDPSRSPSAVARILNGILKEARHA